MSDAAEQRLTYLVTHDFDPSMIEELGDEEAHLSLNWLSRILFERAKAGTVLLVLDCCYGGAVNSLSEDRPLDAAFAALKRYFVHLTERAQRNTRATLAAASKDAVAWERNGTSVMTGELLRALCGKFPEAVDEDGHVTLGRLQDTL